MDAPTAARLAAGIGMGLATIGPGIGIGLLNRPHVRGHRASARGVG